jgi:glycosyltransferase involved in cell wall biosynthesis
VKICISTYTFLPDIGGVATTESILAAAFVTAGHDVTVVTSAKGPMVDHGYKVARRPGPLRLARLYAGADILLLSNLSLKLFYPLLFMRRRFGLRHHSDSAARLSRSWLSSDALRRLVMRRATHFATSGFIGREIGVPHHVVHPFANPAHITPTAIAPAGDRRGALFVGRLEKEKGLLYLLERWPAVRDILGVDDLRIVGDGTLRSELEACNAPGVRYLGPLSLAETAREMGKAAYCLVPSLWEEPFGAVAIEALAAGAIVVLSNRGGLPETVGGLGFAFDPGKPGDFEAALGGARQFRNELLSSPDMQAVYEAASAKHLDQFRPEGAVQKIIQAF